jgi:hypothetical protein
MKLKHLFENEMNAEQAFSLAILKGTHIPEYEDIIANDSHYAYLYAKDIIKGRWPAGEPAIAEDSGYACWYAIYIIKGRWLDLEQYFLSERFRPDLYGVDIQHLYNYTKM